MKCRSLTHLSDQALLTRLDVLDARDRETTAELLVCLAEIDERELFAPLSYESLWDYCVQHRKYSEDVAKKRIRVARVGRRIPAVFEAIAEGRVHFSGIYVLASHLTPGNAEELLAAATHKTRAEIEVLLAERFPRSEVLSLEPGEPIAASRMPEGPVAEGSPGGADPVAPGPPNGTRELRAPGHVDSSIGWVKIKPLAKDSFDFRFGVPGRVVEKIRYSQALASHEVPSDDLATLLESAFDALIEKQEKQKLGITSRTRVGKGPRASSRYIPVAERRKVWVRDEGKCTFVGATGRRCESRRKLQFDHIVLKANGGENTADNLRLLCRTHNQHEAERVLGKEFMEHKRREACERREARIRGAAPARVGAVPAPSDGPEMTNATGAGADRDVVAGLVGLGYRIGEARRVATMCAETLPDRSLEDRIRLALWYLMPPHRRPKAPAIAGWDSRAAHGHTSAD